MTEGQPENIKPEIIDYMDGDPRSVAGFKAAIEGGVAVPKPKPGEMPEGVVIRVKPTTTNRKI